MEQSDGARHGKAAIKGGYSSHKLHKSIESGYDLIPELHHSPQVVPGDDENTTEALTKLDLDSMKGSVDRQDNMAPRVVTPHSDSAQAYDPRIVDKPP